LKFRAWFIFSKDLLILLEVFLYGIYINFDDDELSILSFVKLFLLASILVFDAWPLGKDTLDRLPLVTRTTLLSVWFFLVRYFSLDD